MESTIDLLNTALKGGDSERELSRMLKLGSSTLGVARHRGRLSPKAAGTLASHIGLDPVPWIALAALEAEDKDRDTRLDMLKRRVSERLKQAATTARNS